MERRCLSVTALAWLLACQSEPAPAPSSAPAVAAPDEAPSAVHTWVEPRRPAAALALELSAELVPSERGRAELPMPLAGRVLEVRVAPGDTVRAGQPLVVVALPEATIAAAERATAEAHAARLDERRARLEQLHSEGLSRSADLLELDTERVRVRGEATRARALLAAAGLDGVAPTDERILLRAPLDGVVVAVSAVRGQHRRPEDGALLSVHADVGHRVQATLPEAPPAGARFVWSVAGSADVELRWLSSAPRAGEGRVGITAWLVGPEEQPLGRGRAGRLRMVLPADDDLHVVPATALDRGAPEGTRLWVRRSGGAEAGVDAALVMSLGADVLVRAALGEGDRVALEPGGRS